MTASASDRLTPEQVPWVLPTALPDGLELWTMYSTRPHFDVGFLNTPGGARLVRRSPDGRTIAASISVTTFASSVETDAGVANTVVHGQPASLQDAVGEASSSLSWIEHDLRWFVAASGIAGNELVATVNDAVADADTKTLRASSTSRWIAVLMPTGGYRAGDLGSAAVAGTYHDGQISQLVRVTAESARPGDSLDALITTETRRVVVGGIERSVRDDAVSPTSNAHVVVWFDQGYQVTLTTLALLEASKLEALIAGVELTPAAKARHAAELQSAHASGLPVLAEARTGDTTRLSVHGESGGVRYLCATVGAVTRCAVGSAIDPTDTFDPDHLGYVALPFTDRAIITAWSLTPPEPAAPPSYSPYLQPTDLVTASTGAFRYASIPPAPPFNDQLEGSFRPIANWDLFW